MANVPPASVTVTSTIGPGLTATATNFVNVTDITYDFAKNTIRISHAGGRLIAYYDYSAMGTVTHTISGGLTTIAIS